MRCWSLVLVGAMLAHPCDAADLDETETAEIEALIEKLASPNEEPAKTASGKYLKHPADWDEEAQKQVAKAATALVEKGTIAFPQLIAHAKDERFSFVNTSGNGAETPKSVGVACERIVESQLDVFRQIGIYPRMRPSYFHSIVWKDLDEWWDERQEKSLVELQIEAFEWAMEWQKEKLKAWQTEGEDGEYSSLIPRLEKILAENEETLEKLRETEEPIRRKTHPFRMYEGK